MKAWRVCGAQMQTKIWTLSKIHSSLTKKPTIRHQDNDKSPPVQPAAGTAGQIGGHYPDMGTSHTWQRHLESLIPRHSPHLHSRPPPVSSGCPSCRPRWLQPISNSQEPGFLHVEENGGFGVFKGLPPIPYSSLPWGLGIAGVSYFLRGRTSPSRVQLWFLVFIIFSLTIFSERILKE